MRDRDAQGYSNLGTRHWFVNVFAKVVLFSKDYPESVLSKSAIVK